MAMGSPPSREMLGGQLTDEEKRDASDLRDA
jgi:hypothetical protein